jgi:xylan 1,4-beta-xylosidase
MYSDRTLMRHLPKNRRHTPSDFFLRMKRQKYQLWLLLPLLLMAGEIYGSRKETVHRFCVGTRPGVIIPNMADNVNSWDLQSWHEPMEEEAADHFRRNLPFVKYVQLMTACGGNEQRDLFKNPLDRAVTDDYDFSSLIRACRNILRQGLIPHLKLGNVPLKYTREPVIGAAFGVNVRPPYDYRMWHSYIKALAQSLVDEFGRREVQRWRFGTVTEYENSDWFTLDNDPGKTQEAFFMLYDYTVDALEQVLGKDVCMGAHSMTVSDGLWDERELIAHCARGKNYCTGKTGARLSFLSASYYELSPGVPNERSLPETVNELRDAAIREGMNDLFYGIDEGRILNGPDQKPIYPRATGRTWQAAFDARMYHQMLDHRIDYFSHWSYTVNGLKSGIPSVAKQTSELFYQIAGGARLDVTSLTTDLDRRKTGVIAAVHPKRNKLYLLLYACSESVSDTGNCTIECEIPGFRKKVQTATAIRTLISDDSNFYDDWLADWPRLGLSADDFSWSSESFVISPELLGADRIPYYESCATLKPMPETLSVEDGVLTIRTLLPVHGVLLYEIAIGNGVY